MNGVLITTTFTSTAGISVSTVFVTCPTDGEAASMMSVLASNESSLPTGVSRTTEEVVV